MASFKELDVVRVRILRSSHRKIDGTEGVIRQPAVGDVGTIVHLLGDDGATVECVDPDGGTIWLADFESDELALVSRTG